MTLRTLCSLAVVSLFSTTAYAGSQVGTIDFIIARASDGLTYFGLKGAAKDASPACATQGYWMIKDENSEAGKKQYAMLLAAQASGRPVIVHGMGTCTRWRDGEDVNSIRLNQQ